MYVGATFEEEARQAQQRFEQDLARQRQDQQQFTRTGTTVVAGAALLNLALLVGGAYLVYRVVKGRRG